MNVTGNRFRVVLASTIGNVLEWYDFISFGFLMGIVAKHFFPSSSAASGLLLASATFGVSFFARIFGAVVLGVYADRVGRKAALFLVMNMMFVSTVLITFCPTYSSIGIWASIIMLVARVLQGISAGGDFGGGTAMLVEFAPENRKGFFGSFMLFSQAVAATLASAAGYLVTNLLAPEQLDSWGWRLPFAVGLIIAPVGIYIRRHIEEPAEFKATLQARNRKSFGAFLVEFRKPIFIGIGLATGVNIVQIFFNVYMPSYAVRELHLAAPSAFLAVMLGGIARMLTTPGFGVLADHWGRRKTMVYGCVLTTLSVFPGLIWLQASPVFFTLLTVELIVNVLAQIVNAAMPTALAELFPTEVRSQGLSVCFNGAVTLFGGTTPFIVTWFVSQTGNQLVPGYYATAGMLFSLACAFMIARKPASSLEVAGAHSTSS
ncbi:MFS transporter [Paraburkholderia antibiotica]|uniref:MFS transporter n=1 Tax=Paraburkholderia antibiotica TaxID=2728839 RepID=A0A7Y0FFK6_9BURK|nr:MFS transporter [Paraburkholderia antibiotica]NML34190.1 MFS transporter [Paraburkholderia antibiotica]